MNRATHYHTPHVAALDGLRGYAAVVVTFFHAILNREPALVERVFSPAFDQVSAADLFTKAVLAVFNGSTAVSLFYVLSGAVLCRSLLRSPWSAAQVGMFVGRRALRLFPALVSCLLLMWTMALVYAQLGLQGYPQTATALSVLKNALLLDILVHFPSRSVQIEALATPFILLFAWLYRRCSVPAALLLLALSVFAIERHELVFGLPNMNVSVMLFYVGMMVALPEAKTLFAKVSSTGLLVVFAGAWLLRQFLSINALSGMIAQTLLLGALVGMLMHAPSTGLFQRFLEARISRFLGRISYSYYLLNVPVLYLLWFTPGLSALERLGSPVLGGTLVGVVAFVLTVPLASLSYRYCEAPCIEWGRRMTEKYNAGKSA